MAFGNNPTTGSQSALPSNQFPLASVAVPGTTNGNLTALEGGPASTDTNGNLTAPVSMYVKDGGNVAQGTTTDSAYSGSGAGTEIAILKKLVALLSSAITVSGAVTSNAGTNTSTAALALETGGNLAAAKTDLDAITTAIGTQADSAYGGSGNGSEIALLKKIVAELATTLTISGTITANAGTGTMTVGQATGTNLHTVVDSGSITANAGTNLNTSALALESGGHLANIDTHTPALGQSTMSASAPIVIASDQSNLPANIKAVNGTVIAVGSAALPILASAATGYVSPYASNLTATVATTDYTFKWGASGTTQVNHLLLQNNTTANVQFELDATSSAGSPVLAPGQTLFFDVQTTVVHLYTAAIQNVNGTTGGNVCVKGWL